MGASSASNAMKSDDEQLAELHRRELESSYHAATRLGMDELIDPRETRNMLLSALGLALQIDLDEPLTIAPAGRFGLPGELVEVTSVLVAPTRPGAVLRAMAERRLAVG